MLMACVAGVGLAVKAGEGTRSSKLAVKAVAAAQMFVAGPPKELKRGQATKRGEQLAGGGAATHAIHGGDRGEAGKGREIGVFAQVGQRVIRGFARVSVRRSKTIRPSAPQGSSWRSRVRRHHWR